MKTSSDTAAAEQVSHIEKELENTWQEKLDRMLASANDRHQRAMADVQEEKAALEAKVRDLQEKARLWLLKACMMWKAIFS